VAKPIYTMQLLKILFITGASHRPSDKNLNHFQRAYFLSRKANLTILGEKGSDFSCSAAPGTRIIRAPWPGKIGLIIYGMLWLFRERITRHHVVLTEPSVLGILGYWAKIIHGCRWVVDIWDIPIRCTTNRHPLLQLRCRITRVFVKLIYRRADLYLISILPDFELKSFNLPIRKMAILENAIWMEDLPAVDAPPQQSDEFTIFCMRSHHSRDMGLDILTQAFLILCERLKNLSLIIVGRIPSDVRNQVKGLEGMDNVSFFEFIEHDRLMALIRSVDVCVIPFKNVPDLAQTYPIKVLEYMASGKPVVASDIAGLKKMIINNENGLLFEAGDPKSLADVLETVYHDLDLRIRISREARKTAEKFDCRVKADRVLEYLRHVSIDLKETARRSA